MAYSKKVLEHFKKPRNMGEIKDADGIGKVGNPVCLLPNERVHKNSEAIEIRHLNSDNFVISHDGYYNKVSSAFARKYEGQIITFKNQLGKISLTPEHLIYAISVPPKLEYLRNKNKRKLIPAWYHALQLKKGDIALYPIFKKTEDLGFISMDVPKLKYDFKSYSIPAKIPICPDLLRLFGYFLSEGNVRHKPCNNFISFTLHINEKDIVEDIRKASKKLFGLDIKVKEKPKTKTVGVFLYSARLARFFEKLFGNGAGYKKIPNFIMDLPVKKQKYLLYSLWKGEGYVNLERINPHAGYATISYQLAQQVKTLLLRQGIIPSIYAEKERKKNGVYHRAAYRIYVGQRESLKKLCMLLKKTYNPKSYPSITAWIGKGYLYVPITKKDLSFYNGLVCNIEVSNTHSFISEAFCLHNCGDMMHIYIKVGKDKEGEEIIKDIKFKTFGCVAAISTSSMITDLAKGKTLVEAEKITRDNVAEALEGLPQIKMHCSNLAADGLQAAIKDYRSKKK